MERLNGVLQQQEHSMKTEAVRFRQMVKTYENKMHEKDVTINSLRAKISELVAASQSEKEQQQLAIQELKQQHADSEQHAAEGHAEEVRQLKEELAQERAKAEQVKSTLEENGVDAVSLCKIDDREKENLHELDNEKTEQMRAQLKELDSSVTAQIRRMKEIAQELA